LLTIQQLITLTDTLGPHRQEQPFPKPHFNVFDPSGGLVVVPDKGLDRVFSIPFKDGALRVEEQQELISREGSGPRHIAFHPTRPWAYVINELNSTVTSCRWDQTSGELTAFQVLSALSDDFTGNSRASEIEVHPLGHTVYASNRGEETIAVIKVDPSSGRLDMQSSIPSGGKTPRFLSLSPDARHLYVLNEDSDEIVPFNVDPSSGDLTHSGLSTRCGSPVCMIFRD
jgi:6-phosphogluconolactonase